MKAPSCIAAFSTLLACGSAKTNLSFVIDPPPKGDSSCIGVAGFEVMVSTVNQSAVSGPVLNTGPVLDGSNCRLREPFSMDGVNLDSPAFVVVTGRDGAGAARVEGRAQVDNLRGGSTHLQLQASTPPGAVLVVHRSSLLGGQPISAITQMTIATTAKGKATLIAVGPGAYSSVEPAAYGVGTNLAVDGTDTGQILTVDIMTTQGPVPRAKLNALWNAAGYYDATP